MKVPLESFYYFGKIPEHEEFIGFAPGELRDVLDRWAIELNRREEVALWEEWVLFYIPDRKYHTFLAGIMWNSEDQLFRKYPFTLYVKIESKNPLAISPLVLFDGEKIVGLIQELWDRLFHIDLRMLEIQLSREGSIARLRENGLATADSPRPVIPLNPDWEWNYVKWLPSVKKELLEKTREFGLSTLADECRMFQTPADPPCTFVYMDHGSFHACLEKLYPQRRPQPPKVRRAISLRKLAGVATICLLFGVIGVLYQKVRELNDRCRSSLSRAESYAPYYFLHRAGEAAKKQELSRAEIAAIHRLLEGNAVSDSDLPGTWQGSVPGPEKVVEIWSAALADALWEKFCERPNLARLAGFAARCRELQPAMRQEFGDRVRFLLADNFSGLWALIIFEIAGAEGPILLHDLRELRRHLPPLLPDREAQRLMLLIEAEEACCAIVRRGEITWQLLSETFAFHQKYQDIFCRRGGHASRRFLEGLLDLHRFYREGQFKILAAFPHKKTKSMAILIEGKEYPVHAPVTILASKFKDLEYLCVRVTAEKPLEFKYRFAPHHINMALPIKIDSGPNRTWEGELFFYAQDAAGNPVIFPSFPEDRAEWYRD